MPVQFADLMIIKFKVQEGISLKKFLIFYRILQYSYINFINLKKFTLSQTILYFVFSCPFTDNPINLVF